MEPDRLELPTPLSIGYSNQLNYNPIIAALTGFKPILLTQSLAVLQRYLGLPFSREGGIRTHGSTEDTKISVLAVMTTSAPLFKIIQLRGPDSNRRRTFGPEQLMRLLRNLFSTPHCNYSFNVSMSISF